MAYATFTEGEQTFKTAVVGVTFNNSDGKNRQIILEKLNKNDVLTLQREPLNQYDKYAIAVFTSNNEQIGYIPKNDSQLALHMDQGNKVRVEIVEITGGKTFFQKIFGLTGASYGCIIQIYKIQPDYAVVEPLMKANREIDDTIKEAYRLEKNNPEKSIQLYLKAITLIKKMDSNGKQAIAWRTCKYPISRLSLLLDKAGKKSEALREIESWLQYNDTIDISDADKESVMKRKARLEK